VTRRQFRFAALLILVCAASEARATDANACDPGEIPDVIVGDIIQVIRHGTVSGITAYSIGTTSCNVGTCWLNWFENGPEHPVIGQNLFRLKDGRLEQIGQSWLKHGFFAESEELCNTGCLATDGTHLGVHCSDTYGAGLNGDQTMLGPKSQVNVATGVFPYPYDHQGQTGDAIYKRLQVHDTDLDPVLNAGALYYVESQYVAHDDAAANAKNNNVSYRPVFVVIGAGGVFNLSVDESTERGFPAASAWRFQDGQVREARVEIGDGRMFVYSRATNLGGGMWHYEYAVYDMNSDRGGGSFSVPIPAGAIVQNIGFHDVDYHSGEPYDGTDWPGVVNGATVSWATTPYAVNPFANAIRWGTLYNFRFDVNAAPASNGTVTLGLFKPGSPATVSPLAYVPSACNGNGICELGETCANCAADCVHASPSTCCGDATCQGAENTCNCRADCGPPPAFELACTGGVDDDCDTRTDCADPDCCVDAACVDADADGDGFAACDCNDASGLIWGTPGEAQNLRAAIDRATHVTTLSWDPPQSPGSVGDDYEVLRSDLSSDFTGPSAICVVGSTPNTFFDDPADPAGDALFSYLVRATNACPMGQGPLGNASSGIPRLGLSCP